MKSAILAIVAAVCLISAAPRAQCTPVPNTGCPGAIAPDCRGSAALGQLLFLTCPNSGRADRVFLIIDTCTPQPFVLPGPLGCVPGCAMGVGFQLQAVVDTNSTTVVLQVPPIQNLVGVTLCTQCVGVVSRTPCVTVSQAASFTIQ
jgi:hypothetical protein